MVCLSPRTLGKGHLLWQGESRGSPPTAKEGRLRALAGQPRSSRQRSQFSLPAFSPWKGKDLLTRGREAEVAICFFQWLLSLPGWRALCSPRPPLMQLLLPRVSKHRYPLVCAQHMTARTRGQWRRKPSSYSLTSNGPRQGRFCPEQASFPNSPKSVSRASTKPQPGMGPRDKHGYLSLSLQGLP